ncbi:hypothetical protein [Maricaulis sp. CAU 1757]
MRLSRIGLAAGAVSLALLTGACGFTPMYASGAIGRQLSDIRVETGEERIDFYLQQELLDVMGARQAAGPLKLITETSLRRRGLGVGAEASFARISVEVTVQYVLVDERTGETIDTDYVVADATYESNAQIYSEMVAGRDAEERAARLAAQRLSLKLVRALDERGT